MLVGRHIIQVDTFIHIHGNVYAFKEQYNETIMIVT